MKRLAIGSALDGKPFTLPLETATLASATIGIRGSGKTNTGVVLVEELLSAGQQVVIIDPTDVWWGLRSSFDGKKPGFPIPILGGGHGDVPLTPDMGHALADFVVETGTAAILSIRHLRKGQQRHLVMLATRSGFRIGGAFNVAVARLARMGAADSAGGKVAASSLLFPKGLR